MQRYLLNLSYIGTGYRGMQRQINGALPRQDDPSTIQGCIEMALAKINTKNMPYIVTSSRTDAGVHALSSSCHVDIETHWGKPYEPNVLTASLNKYFLKHDMDIRIINTFAVPQTFHSRHNAIGRTYLYRFVRIKPNPLVTAPLLQHVPIELNSRVWFSSSSEFNEDKMREAAKLFIGYHDFKTFMGKGSQENQINKMTRRCITKFSIEETPLHLCSCFSNPLYGLNASAEMHNYDIYMEAPGFLYNQVAAHDGDYMYCQLKNMLK